MADDELALEVVGELMIDAEHVLEELGLQVVAALFHADIDIVERAGDQRVGRVDRACEKIRRTQAGGIGFAREADRLEELFLTLFLQVSVE